MASVIRFKDIFNKVPNNEGTPFSFKDITPVEYRPGEDELINYRAYRRKRLNEEVVSNIVAFIPTKSTKLGEPSPVFVTISDADKKFIAG